MLFGELRMGWDFEWRVAQFLLLFSVLDVVKLGIIGI